MVWEKQFIFIPDTSLEFMEMILMNIIKQIISANTFHAFSMRSVSGWSPWQQIHPSKFHSVIKLGTYIQLLYKVYFCCRKNFITERTLSEWTQSLTASQLLSWHLEFRCHPQVPEVLWYLGCYGMGHFSPVGMIPSSSPHYWEVSQFAITWGVNSHLFEATQKRRGGGWRREGKEGSNRGEEGESQAVSALHLVGVWESKIWQASQLYCQCLL